MTRRDDQTVPHDFVEAWKRCVEAIASDWHTCELERAVGVCHCDAALTIAGFGDERDGNAWQWRHIRSCGGDALNEPGTSRSLRDREGRHDTE